MLTNMECLNVRKYGTFQEDRTIKDIHGESLDVLNGEQVYFVNTKFSDPSYGFLMTAERVWQKTEGCILTTEEIEKITVEAKKKIAEGDEGLGLKFTLG
jgi:hypothetical protein